MFNYEILNYADSMYYALPLRALIILLLTAAGGSLGGVAYYYQARATSLNSQVSSLNNNAGSLNDQIVALKALIANLTNPDFTTSTDQLPSQSEFGSDSIP